MPGAANSSHVWTPTRSNAGKSAQPQAWLREMEEEQSPLLHWPINDLSATSLIPSPVSNNWLSIHTRERKLVFPVSFIAAHVCKALWEENCQIPQVISVITLDLYVPWACCRPWDQQPSLPFPGRDYVAYQKTKLITLSLKSLNSPQSQFLIYSWMNLKESPWQDPRTWLGTQQQSLKLCSSPQSAAQPSSPPLGTVEMGHHLLHTG